MLKSETGRDGSLQLLLLRDLHELSSQNPETGDTVTLLLLTCLCFSRLVDSMACASFAYSYNKEQQYIGGET